MGSLEAQDDLTPGDIAAIREERVQAKVRFETALEGDDLVEIKAAHAALRATDSAAQTARHVLAGALRKRVHSAVLSGIVDLQTDKTTPRGFEDKIMEIADMMIEAVAKLD